MTNDFLDQQLRIFEAIKDTAPVQELTHKTSLEFLVCTAYQALNFIIEGNDVIVIGGSYFGDEGKGKITDAIANNPLIDLLVRLNSGENAGHTVEHDGIKYVFHLTPSGIMIPGKICAIGSECVMDPVSYNEKEIAKLKKAGVDYRDRLFVGNVHIVGPHHKILDFALSPQNSSTLMGMSYIHSSKVMKRGLRLDDLLNSRAGQEKILKKELDIYNALIKYSGKDDAALIEGLTELAKTRKVPDHLFDFLKARDKTSFILDLYKKQVVENQDFPNRTDVVYLIRSMLRKGKKVLVESPQSYWLSNATEKHWRSSTSAQTHANGVLASSGINLRKYKVAVINVAKTPSDSRVGIGANPSSFVPQNYFSSRKIETLDQLGKNACIDYDKIQRMYFTSIQSNGILKPIEYTDATGTYSISEAMAISSSRHNNEKGSTTGKPRVTGIFDCVAHAYVAEEQGPYLSVSAMDRGDSHDFVGLTVAYVYHNPSEEAVISNGVTYNNGHIIRIGDPYPCDNVLEFCHPIVKVMPGWKDNPIGARKRNPSDPLPRNVQNFLGTIADLTGFEIIGLGNGPDTKNMIYVRRK